MKKLCVTVWVLVLLAGVAANAQDEFKGFYVGGLAGGVVSHSDMSTSTVFSSTGYFATNSVPAVNAAGVGNQGASGLNLSFDAGYNHRWTHWVLGGEADFGAMRGKATIGGSGPYPCCPPTSFAISQTVDPTWLFTARPRIGYAAGKWMWFGTAGFALANLNYRARFTDNFGRALETGGVGTKAGWTAGGGLDYEAARHWDMRFEYLYANFGDATNTSTNLTAFTPSVAYPSNIFTHNASVHANIVRGGINYRF